jgi:catechol 2,3-dioxygenase-like lactoylglutathione lyase family enzyme
MLKIAVFGFYGPDPSYVPVSTEEFMRTVWELEPLETRVGWTIDAPCFVKLTGVASQPVYVQSLSNRMAPGAALLNCDGYVAIIDAVKILAPKTIQNTLHRLSDLHPQAHLIIAAARQNDPEALSADEIRAVLGLHPDLPVYPYVLTEPKTVFRLIKRLARYIDDPNRTAPPIFAGEQPHAAIEETPVPPDSAADPAPIVKPQIHGLAHIAITVSDLTRALDFYRGLLGFRLLGTVEDPGGTTITHLDTGHGVLELFSAPRPAASPAAVNNDCAGLRHLALHVTGLDLILDQLACAGVPVIQPPTDRHGIRFAFVTDPDGIPIELVEGDMIYTRR